MSTKNEPGAYDCYANAEPDEPLFVLLARDRHAPALVALWCCLREMDGEDVAKVKEARACAIQMMAWGAARGRTYVGFGQTTLVGIMELIRTANLALKDAPNEATREDFLRQVMSRTEIGKPAEGEADFERLLAAASHALKSYAHGNASPELAQEVSAAIDAALARVKGA